MIFQKFICGFCICWCQSFRLKLYLLKGKKHQCWMYVTFCSRQCKFCQTDRKTFVKTFVPLKVRELLKKLREGRQKLKNKESKFYDRFSPYTKGVFITRKRGRHPSMISALSFDVLNKVQDSLFDDLLPYIEYMNDKGFVADDVQLFDQYCNVKSFAEQKDDEFVRVSFMNNGIMNNTFKVVQLEPVTLSC